MIAAIQSAQEAFGACWMGAGLVVICSVMAGFVWRRGRDTAALDRWFYFLLGVIIGIGLIAFGWVVYHS